MQWGGFVFSLQKQSIQEHAKRDTTLIHHCGFYTSVKIEDQYPISITQDPIPLLTFEWLQQV